MAQYQVNTQHTKEAYRTYARVHIDARGGSVFARAVSVLLGLLILAGGVVAIAYAGFRLLYMLSVGLGLLVMFGRPLGVWRVSHQLERSVADMSAVIRYDFGDDGFVFTSPDEGGTVKYSEIDRIYETKNYYFVYVALKMAHILAKRDFTAGDPAAFGAFLTKKTGKPCVRREY